MFESLREDFSSLFTPKVQKAIRKEGSSITLKVIEKVLIHAIRNNISDIHIEPHEGYLIIRFRKDGILYDALKIEEYEVRENLVSSIRAQAGIVGDGARVKRAVDGRWSIDFGGEVVDFRLSFFPLVNGEKLVMRIFRQSKVVYDLDNLGMNDKELSELKEFLLRKNGIIFVTGPTGSGKTTTLYSIINYLNKPEINISTLEDPVEFKFDRINQTQIDAAGGFDFPDGLRALLRQDPDIILVGEVRDALTAEIAIRASLTGHLVLTTLHTNDAPTVVSRLIDMNIEPFLITSTAMLVINQRLVRKLCELCKEPTVIPDYLPSKLDILRTKEIMPYKAVGCEVCGGFGYLERVPVFEFLCVDDNMRHLILKKSSYSEIKKYAIENGMKTLMEDAVALLENGDTTIDEIISVIDI